MRIAVMGAGGIGGNLGGLLARDGNQVTLIARGAHLEAIRSQGLRVKMPGDKFTLGQLTKIPNVCSDEAGP